MTIANYLTFIRIFISPIFLFVYLEYDSLALNIATLPYLLLFLFGISELSDALDGYLARRYNQVTDFGKILDPTADSIYRLSVFLTFTLPPVRLPMILVFIMFYRDCVISALRTICAIRGITLAARWSGKIKAVIQAVAIFCVILLLIPFSLGWISQEKLELSATIIVGFTSFYAFLSGAEYIYANREHIRRMLIPPH